MRPIIAIDGEFGGLPEPKLHTSPLRLDSADFRPFTIVSCQAGWEGQMIDVGFHLHYDPAEWPDSFTAMQEALALFKAEVIDKHGATVGRLRAETRD